MKIRFGSFRKILTTLCGINPSLNIGWRGIMKINVMFAVLESKAVRLGINSPLLSLWRGLSHSTSTLVHIDKNSSTENYDRVMCVLQSIMWYLRSLKAKPWGWGSTCIFYHFDEDFPIPTAHRCILKGIPSNLKSGGKIMKDLREICGPWNQSHEVGDQLTSTITLMMTFPPAHRCILKKIASNLRSGGKILKD